jgi:hypothetical protein
MGLSQSKAKATTNSAVISPELGYTGTPLFMAPNNIVDKIKGLGDVIGFFNDNDTSALEGFVDDYNKKVASKDKIDLGPEIKNLLLSFHNQLLTVIDGQVVGATPAEKQQILKSKLKDNKQLNEMLSLYYNDKLRSIETRVLNDETVRGNKELGDTVKTILGNVKSLKVKYKFFEYKYIQLNIFMIVFIQYVYNSMTKFIVDVIAYNQVRDAFRQEMTQKIFDATKQIMSTSDIQIKPQDADAVNKLIQGLQDKVKRDQEEIQEMSAKLKNNSMADLLNFVLKSDENLASHIVEGVEKYKQNQPFPSNQNPNKPWSQNPNKQWQNKQGQTPNPSQDKYWQPRTYTDPNDEQYNMYGGNNDKMKGGFIRDMSLLPQAFHAL